MKEPLVTVEGIKMIVHDREAEGQHYTLLSGDSDKPMQKSDLTTNPRLTIGLPSILLVRFHVKTELCDLQWDLFALSNYVSPDEKG